MSSRNDKDKDKDGQRDCRIYVGNLPPDIRTKDIEELFHKYGKIVFVDLKNRNNRGPPFAFIEFDDQRDAEDAVRGRDGYDYDGYRLRVEFPRGGGPRGPGGRHLEPGSGGRYEGGGGGGGGGRYEGGGGGGGYRDRQDSRGGPPQKSGARPSRRTNYRVMVTGLPPSGSWQDLKDHMREAGDVCYADVFRDGTGVVEYLRSEDMKYALRKLDDTKFRSHEGETAYVRVAEDTGERRGAAVRNGREGTKKERTRSPTPKARPRGSPTYSPARKSRSASHSRSRSPRRSRSASRSRSRS